MEVSVVIPTYNEIENIEPLVDEIHGELEDRDFEIVIVDDDSPDGTAEKVSNMQESRDFLKLVERKKKSGIGSAHRRGFRESKGDFVVQMDADFSHPPRYIRDLLEALEEGADVAVGSRYVEGGDRKDPLHRRIFPLVGSYLYRYGLGFPVKDFTSGFKAYRREVVEEEFDNSLPDGFHFQAASLLRIVEDGYEVVEVPIEFEERRAGKPKYDHMDLVKNAWFFGKQFIRKNQRPLKFGTVGASGVIVNMGLLYTLTEFAGLFYLFSSAIAVETSIIWNFFWNETWTFSEIGKETWRKFFERLAKFNTVSLVGLGLNLAILFALTEFAGLHYLISNVFAIMAVFAWNYLGNVKWTWNGD
jgi:dolichol-phosphate mannosyltransferase